MLAKKQTEAEKEKQDTTLRELILGDDHFDHTEVRYNQKLEGVEFAEGKEGAHEREDD